MRQSFPGVHFNNRQELTLLAVTALQAIFIGGFVALFTIGTHILFLQMWVPENIPQAFIISGVFGLIMFSAYSFLNSRISFRSFSFYWLFFVFIVTLALYIFYEAIIELRLFGMPLMLPFTLTIPFSFLMLNVFRRQAQNAFTPNQHRRFNPPLRIAFVAGIIGASYLLVGALYIQWDILIILAVSAIFAALACILQIVLNVYHRSSGSFPQPARRVAPLRSKFYEIFYTRYTLLLVVFTVISGLIGFIIHYSFVAETRFNYPDTIGLAKFFGFFYRYNVCFRSYR